MAMTSDCTSTSRDFGLRPSPPNYRFLNRSYEFATAKFKKIQQRSSSTEDEINSMSSGNSSELTQEQATLEAPVELGTDSSDDSTSSRTISPSNSKQDQGNLRQDFREANPDELSGIGRYVGGAIQHPNLSHSHPLNRSSRRLWQQGSDAVRRPDGTVEEEDVINWMLTRPGGLLGPPLPWPRLEEARRVVQEMSNDTIDFDKIRRKQQKVQKDLERQEERRLARQSLFEYRVARMKEFSAKQADAEIATTQKRPLENAEVAEENTDIQNRRYVDGNETGEKRVRLNEADDADIANEEQMTEGPI